MKKYLVLLSLALIVVLSGCNLFQSSNKQSKSAVPSLPPKVVEKDKLLRIQYNFAGILSKGGCHIGVDKGIFYLSIKSSSMRGDTTLYYPINMELENDDYGFINTFLTYNDLKSSTITIELHDLHDLSKVDNDNFKKYVSKAVIFVINNTVFKHPLAKISFKALSATLEKIFVIEKANKNIICASKEFECPIKEIDDFNQAHEYILTDNGFDKIKVRFYWISE